MRSLATFLAASALTTVLVGAPSASAEPKYAVIDLRRAVAETEEGLRVQATLRRLADARQGEVTSREMQLKAQQTQINQQYQSGQISQAQAQQQIEAWQRQVLELQALGQQYTREMQVREQELMSPIYAKVVSVVRALTAQQGYDMVIEKTFARYYKPELEITDRAIQMYNSGGAAPPANAKPGAPAPAPAAAPATSSKATTPNL